MNLLCTVLWLLSICSIFINNLNAASRNQPPAVLVNQPQQQSSHQNNQNDDDPNLLPYFLSILGDFGKILLNPNNTAHVTQQVAHMIDGIIAVAHEVTKSKLSAIQKQKLIAMLTQHFQQKYSIRR